MDTEIFFHHQTEQLIADVMSFLDDNDEHVQVQKADDDKNPICWAIKRIINVEPEQATSEETNSFETHTDLPDIFHPNYMCRNEMETECRYKDPYIQEVNRLMSTTALGQPTEGSPEYYQAAENYALFGKEFLDFPIDLKFVQPSNVASFGDVPAMPTSLVKLSHSPILELQGGTRLKQRQSSRSQQQQIFVNQTNYCSYPHFQMQNVVPPLIYSNPLLMSQLFSAIMKESQMNASLMQQQILAGAGIHEQWLYAQMLQHQMQANHTALMSCYLGSATGSNAAKNKHELVKTGSASHANEADSLLVKPSFDGGGVCENPTAEI